MKNRAYKYRFTPTDEQVTLLAQTFGCIRYAYNSILRWRTDSYYQSKEKMGYIQASSQLTDIKNMPELFFLNDVQNTPLSKRKAENNRLNLLKVHSNTGRINTILPRAKNLLIFDGHVNFRANPASLPFPKTAQGVIFFRASAN